MSLCRIMFFINHSAAFAFHSEPSKQFPLEKHLEGRERRAVGEIENSTMMGFTADELPSTGREQEAQGERK